MPKVATATLSLLLLAACAGPPEADDAARLAGLAGQRIKLEDLTYCTAEVQDRAEWTADDPAFAAAVDRCMASLGYRRVDAPPP